jgi:uncharacterized protein YjaZ
MEFKILDTEATYRRLLATDDPAQREAIFCAELVEPFDGIVRVFGGQGLSSFAQWGMSPEQYAPEHREKMGAILDQLGKGDVWNRAAKSLEVGKAAFAAFAAYADRIPTKEVIFGLSLANMDNIPGQRGYSGFGAIPGWIMTVYGQPDEYNMARVEAATVHELHHNILAAASPKVMNMMVATLADYMIAEGLAESFSKELYGEDKIGPWVTEFDETNLDQTIGLFRNNLEITGFDKLRSFIFGDEMSSYQGLEKVGVPAFAGYALGYRVVQAYLARTGQSVVEATFVPAKQIVAESQFFA